MDPETARTLLEGVRLVDERCGGPRTGCRGRSIWAFARVRDRPARRRNMRAAFASGYRNRLRGRSRQDHRGYVAGDHDIRCAPRAVLIDTTNRYSTAMTSERGLVVKVTWKVCDIDEDIREDMDAQIGKLQKNVTKLRTKQTEREESSQ